MGSDRALEAIDRFISEQPVDKSVEGWRTRLEAPPAVEFDAATVYVWTLETSLGPIRIKLFADVAPRHVASTIYLTRLGFYDGLVFHRVISEFMAQGGCPSGTGSGGPGYQYDGEFDASAVHDRPGLLSMANAGQGTDGSQFFLTFAATPWLDGKHTLFGEVVEGMDTLRELEKRGASGGKPTERLEIQRASVSAE